MSRMAAASLPLGRTDSAPTGSFTGSASAIFGLRIFIAADQVADDQRRAGRILSDEVADEGGAGLIGRRHLDHSEGDLPVGVAAGFLRAHRRDTTAPPGLARLLGVGALGDDRRPER